MQRQPRRYKVEFPEKFEWLIECMNEAEAALMTDPEPLRPCHNDLLNANFLIDDDKSTS